MTNTTLTPKPRLIVQDDGMNQTAAEPRFMIWIDGVGGYLTCLGNRVRIGQAIPGTRVEVPVIGDLSRHHATLQRQGEGYVIEPHSATWVNSKPVHDAVNLSDGDEIRFGSSFTMRFRQPHALSNTARLDFLTHHRCQPSADAVLLMAGACVLGPASNSHVVCRGWDRELVIVRQGQSLVCQSSVPFEVDGAACERRSPLTLDSSIQGDDFCVSLERIG